MAAKEKKEQAKAVRRRKRQLEKNRKKGQKKGVQNYTRLFLLQNFFGLRAAVIKAFIGAFTLFNQFSGIG